MDTAEIDAMVEQRLAQYREVPDLLEWHLPIGAAVLQLIAENRPLPRRLRPPAGGARRRFFGGAGCAVL